MADSTSGTSSIDVLVVSGNRLLREALARLLRKRVGIREVTSAPHSSDTVRQVVQAKADILLLDPVGVARAIPETVRQIKDEVPDAGVILFGMEPDLETFVSCVGAGIAGYVLKDASGRDLAQAVIAVANGLAVCPPDLCLGLFRVFARPRRCLPNLYVKSRLGLTNREEQLIDFIRSGSTNKEIAAELSLAEQTVKNHVHRILRKLGVSDRLTAVEIYQTEGFA
jgi:two-component system nitrate/nitrite response regulator NarL